MEKLKLSEEQESISSQTRNGSSSADDKSHGSLNAISESTSEPVWVDRDEPESHIALSDLDPDATYKDSFSFIEIKKESSNSVEAYSSIRISRSVGPDKHMPKNFLDKKIASTIEVLRSNNYKLHELHTKGDNVLFEFSFTVKAKTLNEAFSIAERNCESIEENVNQKLSEFFNVVEIVEKAEKDDDAEYEARYSRFDYNGKSYPVVNGVPRIPLDDLISIPIQNLQSFSKIKVVKGIRQDVLVDPYFTLQLGPNIAIANFLLDSNDMGFETKIFGSMYETSFIKYITSNPGAFLKRYIQEDEDGLTIIEFEFHAIGTDKNENIMKILAFANLL